MNIGGIGQSISSFLGTTAGRVTAAVVGTAVVAGGAYGISRLLADDKASSVKDAAQGARLANDVVCDEGITGRQWCREATDLDYALESGASSAESSALSSESSTGY